VNDAVFEIRSESPPVTLVGVQGVAGRMDAEFFRPVFVRNEGTLRGGVFSVAKLGDLILKGNYGSLPDSGDYSSSGVPLIRGTDLRSMVVTLDSAVRVPEGHLDKFKKAQVQPGDLLMLAKGASLDRPDSVAMYPLDGPTALANGSIFIMRADRKKVNPFFLLGYLASEALLLQKRRASTNTGALYNDIGSISGFLVPLPDRRIQDYIGAQVELAERCRARALLERQCVADAFDKLLAESQFGAREAVCRWVPGDEMLTRWLNAGYYRQVFSDLDAHLRGRSVRTISLGSVAKCNRQKDRPEGVVRYIEIGDIDPEEGVISGGRECTPEATPKNAQRIVGHGRHLDVHAEARPRRRRLRIRARRWRVLQYLPRTNPVRS
jgi:type I restriction enzyme S subunit